MAHHPRPAAVGRGHLGIHDFPVLVVGKADGAVIAPFPGSIGTDGSDFPVLPGEL